MGVLTSEYMEQRLENIQFTPTLQPEQEMEKDKLREQRMKYDICKRTLINTVWYCHHFITLMQIAVAQAIFTSSCD